MLVLFLDESGDHDLINIDPDYPVFVLAGCIMYLDYHDRIARSLINAYKSELFESTDIILRTADITRNRGPFERLKEPEFRQSFYEKTNRLMSELDYMVIAAVIDKNSHKRRYGSMAMDPYFYSLEVVLERFVFELDDRNDVGKVMAESRSKYLDTQLDLAYKALIAGGTRFLEPARIKRRIVHDLEIHQKQENIPGLQVADLVASPIGRHVLRKPDRPDWTIVESKFRRVRGNYWGTGLVILPKS